MLPITTIYFVGDLAGPHILPDLSTFPDSTTALGYFIACLEAAYGVA